MWAGEQTPPDLHKKRLKGNYLWTAITTEKKWRNHIIPSFNTARGRGVDPVDTEGDGSGQGGTQGNSKGACIQTDPEVTWEAGVTKRAGPRGAFEAGGGWAGGAGVTVAGGGGGGGGARCLGLSTSSRFMSSRSVVCSCRPPAKRRMEVAQGEAEGRPLASYVWQNRNLPQHCCLQQLWRVASPRTLLSPTAPPQEDLCFSHTECTQTFSLKVFLKALLGIPV